MTASTEAPEILLQHHLKKLKLPTVLREYEKIARPRRPQAASLNHLRASARGARRRTSTISATWRG